MNVWIEVDVGTVQQKFAESMSQMRKNFAISQSGGNENMEIKDLAHYPKSLDENIKIARYLSFSKFFDLLESKKLFVPNAETLNDKYEGIPHSDHEIMMMAALETLSGKKENSSILYSSKMAQRNNTAQQIRNNFAVSCWTIFDTLDSYLMWMAYSNLFDGVAIVTTIKNLIKALPKIDGDVYMDKISYGQSTSECRSEFAEPYFKKEKYYEDEREIRIIYDKFSMWDATAKSYPFYTPGGLLIPIQPMTIIQKVIVAPQMPSNMKITVENFLRNKGLYIEVDQSKIAKDPITSLT